jgi:putative flippase GtrA
MNKQWIAQACKYGIVGVVNTLLTAAVIGLMMRFWFQLNNGSAAPALALSVSNIVGYAAGLVNSFVWNRRWTFHSRTHWKIDFLKFVGAFLVCYIPQLLLVMLLNQYAHLPSLQLRTSHFETTVSAAYLCQLIGIVFYTTLNFLSNKYYTFKS